MIPRGTLGLNGLPSLPCGPLLTLFRPQQLRALSSTTPHQQDAAARVAKLDPRWLSDTKSRLGKCILFGMDQAQTTRAGMLLADVSLNWRTLLAGSEGFPTDPRRTGISSAPIDWGSQDAMGHVNNVQYVRYAESSRTNWTRQIGEHFDREHKRQWSELLSSKSIGLILRSIKVDYKFPMTWPDRISVYHKLRSMPTETDSSMLLDVMILSEGKERVAARCEEDVVVYNYKAGKKSALPDYMLTQFRHQFEEQEEAKRLNSQKVSKILEEVERLEKETWDRVDAKEDLGSAT
ncbi:hypothetical protein H2198_002322 [Neophaeococcomyces mojaviensis]|uniref:Uncharacterized protein n=1 Tax=Neophaeococcomyces mojaviensis TaxID=3383035 RepID=A0ACC3AEW7_9EURO|nr:hypothetical protein H2198_002322 [Knufia sp. JES_112]